MIIEHKPPKTLAWLGHDELKAIWHVNLEGLARIANRALYPSLRIDEFLDDLQYTPEAGDWLKTYAYGPNGCGYRPRWHVTYDFESRELVVAGGLEFDDETIAVLFKLTWCQGLTDCIFRI